MFETICKLLEDRFDVPAADMTMDTDVKEDLKADSLDVVELMMDLEDETGIAIPDEKAAEMKTIGDIVRYIEAEQK